MEPDRDEVYERIPWETLERKSNDRQWLVYALAGAVTLGALAYSFMKNQPVPGPPASEPPASTAPVAATAPTPLTPSTLVSPVVMAEADLFAVDPERLADQAAAYAEWFVIEYFLVDGSEESATVLSSMLPQGVPLPEAPEGTQVFVDWARAQSVVQSGPTSFDVEVLVRSLVSSPDGGFTRLAPRVAIVSVGVGEDGGVSVLVPPTVAAMPAATSASMVLSPLPDDVRSQLEESHGQVVGGAQLEDGRWQVVVMIAGSDGVTRPVTVLFP
jgi:hypothetical protein